MAGAMRKMGVYLGLVEDDPVDGADEYETYGSTARSRSAYDRSDDARDDRDDRDGYGRAVSSSSSRARAPRSDWGRDDDDDFYDAPVAVAPVRRVEEPAVRRATWNESSGSSSMGSSMGSSVATAPKRSSYRITTLHPRTYNEARTIGEHFRDHVPVIMNLSEMDDADAKRLVDFAAGLSFGLHGSIERVTNKVFLLSPQNVSVTAEDKARIAEGGFFNQS